MILKNAPQELADQAIARAKQFGLPRINASFLLAHALGKAAPDLAPFLTAWVNYSARTMRADKRHSDVTTRLATVIALSNAANDVTEQALARHEHMAESFGTGIDPDPIDWHREG